MSEAASSTESAAITQTLAEQIEDISPMLSMRCVENSNSSSDSVTTKLRFSPK